MFEGTARKIVGPRSSKHLPIPCKLRHYYWVEDYLLVQEAVQAKSGHESQITLTRLEACMYGFGGKYSDDNGNDPNTVNIDDANPEDIQAFMSGFGFKVIYLF